VINFFNNAVVWVIMNLNPDYMDFSVKEIRKFLNIRGLEI